jgi:hypothetical protein
LIELERRALHTNPAGDTSVNPSTKVLMAVTLEPNVRSRSMKCAHCVHALRLRGRIRRGYLTGDYPGRRAYLRAQTSIGSSTGSRSTSTQNSELRSAFARLARLNQPRTFATGRAEFVCHARGIGVGRCGPFTRSPIRILPVMAPTSQYPVETLKILPVLRGRKDR